MAATRCNQRKMKVLAACYETGGVDATELNASGYSPASSVNSSFFFLGKSSGPMTLASG